MSRQAQAQPDGARRHHEELKSQVMSLVLSKNTAGWKGFGVYASLRISCSEKLAAKQKLLQASRRGLVKAFANADLGLGAG